MGSSESLRVVVKALSSLDDKELKKRAGMVGASTKGSKQDIILDISKKILGKSGK